jgi:hypothetical protein
MLRTGHAILAAYVIVGVAYIAVSVMYPEAILSWVQGAGVLVVAFGILPFIYRQLRR